MVGGWGWGNNSAGYLEWGGRPALVPRPMTPVPPGPFSLGRGGGVCRIVTPPLPDYGPTIFGGVIERTLRLGLTGRAQLLQRVDLDFDAALHVVSNKDHVSGVSDTRFVGRVKGAFRFGGPVRLP